MDFRGCVGNDFLAAYLYGKMGTPFSEVRDEDPRMANIRPDSELSAKILELVRFAGLSRVARALGLADATVARLAAGISVSSGTVAQAQQRFERAERAIALRP